MAKIIYEDYTFQEVSLNMFHESEIQRTIASRSKTIFPGYFYSPFNPLVETEDDSGKPDFALIENGFRRWYVGEVEMIRHDLVDHVLRQVRIFNSGFYDESHSEYIAKRLPHLNSERLKLLIESVRPTVLVVVDKMDATWREMLHSQGAKMAIFEVFRREETADLIFRVNGDAPEIPAELLSYCEFDKSFPRLLKLNTPSSVPAANGEIISVECNGILSEWTYMISEDKGWLNPEGNIDLHRESKYTLSKTIDGSLRLEAK